MRLVSIYFALIGLLPSLTQMAPYYRELNKYEANNGAQRNRVQHDVTSCKPSRGHPAHGSILRSLPATCQIIPAASSAARVTSPMICSPVTMSGRLAMKTLTTSVPASVRTNPTSLTTVE